MIRLLVTVSALAVLSLAVVVIVGGVLAAPRQQLIGEPPGDIGAEPVLVPRNKAAPISAWFLRGDPQRAGILLLHGVRSDRRQMVGRARFLHGAGYSVLLIDMQGHGETPGKQITFGYRESHDAHMALAYLRSRVPGQPVGVIGVSMGGAAALLGDEPVEADALVLEAIYSSIEQAVENRLAIRLGYVGSYLAPLLLWQLEPILGIPVKELSPLSAISQLRSPVFILGGTDDRRTRLEETQLLFSRAPKPKRLWMLEGAKHQDFHRYVPEEYERNILKFFEAHLHGDA